MLNKNKLPVPLILPDKKALTGVLLETLAIIAFQQPGHHEWVRSGRLVDVCYTVVENHFRGTVTPQLRVKDIKPVL